MKFQLKQICICIFLVVMPMLSIAFDITRCVDKDYTIQLLGSGGPIPGDSRAQSGTVLWWNNKSKILIDVGSGVFLRFNQADAKIEDLDFLGITHLHTDHSVDIPAFIKAGYFSSRKAVLDISGPSGNQSFPSINQYFQRLFNSKDGVYAYLGDIFSNNGDAFPVRITEVATKAATNKQVLVFKNNNFKIFALSVPHGNVPALAYRIDSIKGSVVISGDQNGKNPKFIQFAKGANVLIMALAIDEHVVTDLHATPSTIGQMAQEINPKILILNHFMGSGLVNKNNSLQIIKKYYKGIIVGGRDLECIPIGKI